MHWLKTHYYRDNTGTEITWVWACTDNGRKQNSQKYEFGNNKAER